MYKTLLVSFTIFFIPPVFAGLPFGITEIATWNASQPGNSKQQFEIYALRVVTLDSSRTTYIVSYNVGSKSEVAPIEEKLAKVLIDEDLVGIEKLLYSAISIRDGKTEKSKVHNAFCGSTASSHNVFQLKGEVSPAGFSFSCLTGLSAEAARMIDLLKSAYNDPKRKTLAEMKQ